MVILPFVHEKSVRSPRHIRVNGDGLDKYVRRIGRPLCTETYKYEFIVFPVEVVEVISPEVLDISRIYETMAVRRGFDEHHGWQVLA